MSANPGTAAPTGRKKPAQGKERSGAALSHASQNTSSPEGAKEGGNLPHGWTRLTMGEVGRWFGGGTPSKANPRFWIGGKIPWVSPKDMKFDLITDAQDHITEDAVAQSATNLVEEGSILIVVRSGILQHTLPVAVASRQVALNQDLKAVKPRENIRSDYLALALKAFERDILHTCTKTGTTVQSLELPVFLRFQIPVAPLPEQRRIVAEIEKQFTRLEAGVTALRRVQANLKRYRAAVLESACEGRLVPTEAELSKTGNRKAPFETGEALLTRILTERRKNWQGRSQYKEPVAPETETLPPLPHGWTVASVDQLSGHITSGSRDWSQFYDKGTGTFILAQNVRPMRLDLSERQSVDAPKGDAETERTRVRRSDILVTIVGAKTGDVCRVPSELDDHFVCQSVALLRPVLQDFAKFTEMYLASQENGQAQWKRFIYGQGRPHLSFEQLRMTAIALPPLAEQTRIVAEVERRLSVVEELEAVVYANLQRATRLRQSILQKAFTGKLTKQ